MNILAVQRNHLKVSAWSLLTNFIGRKSMSTHEPPLKVVIERVVLWSVQPSVWIDVSIVPRRNDPSLMTVECRTPKHIIDDLAIGKSRLSLFINFYLVFRVDDWDGCLHQAFRVRV